METNIRDILLHDFIKKYKDYDVQVVDENFPNYKILTYSFIWNKINVVVNTIRIRITHERIKNYNHALHFPAMQTYLYQCLESHELTLIPNKELEIIDIEF